MAKTRLTKRWVVLPKRSDDLLDQLLYNRDIGPNEREHFLSPDYHRDLYDPFMMKGMEEAVGRVIKAIKTGETVALFGDYDADGTPAVAMLADFFRLIQQPVIQYIPTREEGYGLNREAIRKFKKAGATLLFTADCGVRNREEIAFAKAEGIDTIVCDHHLPPDELPPGIILNPKQVGDSYPFKELCGSGVAFKLLQALVARAPRWTKDISQAELEKFLKWETDLVGLATIVDMVPLVGENRVLAKFGLLALQKTRRPGLRHLFAVAGIDPSTIDTYTASFLIGPRLNAAGRMDNATQAFYLLTTTDPKLAEKLAGELNELNYERQRVLDKVLAEARSVIEKDKLYQKKIIIVHGENWPHGVIGLVAGKLVEEYARPVLVFERGKIRSKGSARSIDAFHIVEALSHAQDILLKYGGHARAAGATIETKHLSTLYDKLLEYAEGTLDDKDLVPTLTVDAEVDLDTIGENTLKIVEQFEPHGVGNPRPLFLSRDCIVQQVRAVGANGKHLKLTINGKDAIAFDLGELSHDIAVGEVVDLVFGLERNAWKGRSALQLKVLDLKKSGTD